MRAMFINATGTDPKPVTVTVTFYEAKLALLGKNTAGEKASCCNRVHQLAKEGDRSGKAEIAQEIVKDVKVGTQGLLH